MTSPSKPFDTLRDLPQSEREKKLKSMAKVILDELKQELSFNFNKYYDVIVKMMFKESTFRPYVKGGLMQVQGVPETEVKGKYGYLLSRRFELQEQDMQNPEYSIFIAALYLYLLIEVKYKYGKIPKGVTGYRLGPCTLLRYNDLTTELIIEIILIKGYWRTWPEEEYLREIQKVLEYIEYVTKVPVNGGIKKEEIKDIMDQKRGKDLRECQ